MTDLSASLCNTMKEFARVFEEIDADWDLRVLRQKIAKLHNEMALLDKELTTSMSPFRNQLDHLEEQIEAEVLGLGVSVNYAGVAAKYRKGYTSETYPVADVRKILLSNPAILPAFNAISVKKTVNPSVSISYTAPEGSDI